MCSEAHHRHDVEGSGRSSMEAGDEILVRKVLRRSSDSLRFTETGSSRNAKGEIEEMKNDERADHDSTDRHGARTK